MSPIPTERLDLLLPHEVPSESLLANWTFYHPFSVGAMEHRTNSTLHCTSAEMSASLKQLLAELPPGGRVIVDPVGQPDDLAHDAYFQVRRVEQDEPIVFLRSILSSRLIFLNEVTEGAVTIDCERLQQIDRGFADLLSCLWGGSVNSGQSVTEFISDSEACTAQRRWIRGHLVFAALTQGLIFSFRSLARALRDGHNGDVQKWADLSTSLLYASAGAFVFTGDFEPGEYENTIRPSMTPPASPIGLSGLMSADHRYLAQTIRDMRPALKSLADQEPDRHDSIAAALNEVYDSHIHVCERFVGSRPSILTAGRTERSGPSLIEQFKTLRLKPFEHSHRAPQLTAQRGRVPLGECPFRK